LLLQRPLHLLGRERFDRVALLDVVVAVELDTALEAGAHFLGVVFHTPEAGEFAGPDRLAVADQPAGPGALDQAVADETAGDRADLRDLERLPHRRVALDDFLLDRLEHAFERLADLIDHVVDDLVGADIHAALFGQAPRAGIGGDTEAD